MAELIAPRRHVAEPAVRGVDDLFEFGGEDERLERHLAGVRPATGDRVGEASQNLVVGGVVCDAGVL